MNGKNFTLGDNVEHFTIADVARDNPDFRKVLWTAEHAQIVVMTIPPGGQIGDEVHEHTDQILTFVSGTGEADLNGHTHPIDAGDQCAVPASTAHRSMLPAPPSRPGRKPTPPKPPVRTNPLGSDPHRHVI